MRRISLIFLCSFWILLSCTSLIAQSGDLFVHHQHYSTENGLRPGWIRNYFQSREGILWIANSTEIYRFDGHASLSLNSSNSELPVGEIIDLQSASEEELWILMSTLKGLELWTFDLNTFHFTPFAALYSDPPFEEKGVLSIRSAGENGIYVHTYGKKVFYCSAHRDRKILRIGEDLEGKPLSLSEDGCLLISGNNLTYFDTAGQELNQIQGQFKSSAQFGGMVNQDEGYFAYSPNNLVTWFNFKDSLTREIPVDEVFPFLDAPASALPNFWINPNDGYFWTFYENDLLIHKPGEMPVFQLSTDYERADLGHISPPLFLGPHEAWVGASGGLYYLRLGKSPFHNLLTTQEMGSSHSTRGIATGPGGEIYVHSYQGGYRISVDLETVSPLDLKEVSTQSDCIPGLNFGRAVFCDHKGQVWMDYEGECMLRWKNGNVSSVSGIDLPVQTFAQHAQDQQHRIWLGTYIGLWIYSEATNSFEQVSPKDSVGQELKTAEILWLEPANEAQLWICTMKGLFLLDIHSQNCTRWWTQGDPGLPDNRIAHVYPESDSSLWLASLGGGLIHFNPERGVYRQWGTGAGLISEVIYAVYPDASGNLWLSTQQGLVRFDPQQETCMTFLSGSGLKNKEFNTLSHHRGPDGTLYFGGLNGVTAFHPDTLNRQVSLRSPVPAISFVTYQDPENGTPVDLTLDYFRSGKMIFPPGVKVAEVGVNLPFEDFVEDIHYRETTQYPFWQDLSGTGVLLNRFPPGEYSLELKAGLTGKIIEVPIRFRAFFYQTKIFRYLVLICGLLLLSGAFIWKRKEHFKEKQKLKEAVKKRTKTIHTQVFELANKAEMLEELDRQKSKFFANISHELQTPLTLILAPLQSSLDSISLPAEERENLEIALDSTYNLKARIDQLLSLAKLQEGQYVLFPKLCPLTPLLEKVTQPYLGLANRTEIEFKVSIDIPESLTVWLDSEKLSIILANLLSNAFKFTPAGGEVEFLASRKKDTFLLSVKDNGPGLPPEEQAKIFQRYYQSQVENGSTTKKGGVGIGLAMSHELAAMMEGELSVWSEVGKGCEFMLRLPAAQPPEQDSLSQKGEQEESPPFQAVSSEYILVVEDHPGMRAFLEKEISGILPVITASHGNEALKRIRLSPPGLIISDLQMPKMDGLELLAQVKKEFLSPDIPFIILTAYNNPSQRLSALRIGVDDFLSKPFRLEELKARVKRLLINQKVRKEALVVDPPAPGEDPSWLSQVEFIVRAEIHAIEVNKLAYELSMAPRTLQRQLKKMVGLSPKAYIIGIRMQVAHQMMEAHPELTIKQIASKTGFSSREYFSQAFKKHFGISPTELKKRMEGLNPEEDSRFF